MPPEDPTNDWDSPVATPEPSEVPSNDLRDLLNVISIGPDIREITPWADWPRSIDLVDTVDLVLEVVLVDGDYSTDGFLTLQPTFERLLTANLTFPIYDLGGISFGNFDVERAFTDSSEVIPEPTSAARFIACLLIFPQLRRRR